VTTNQAGQRQQQSQGPQLPGPNRILSDEQMEYVTQAAELRRKAVSDPYLNGEDSRGRVKLDD
jgi:hypothetical protein